MRSLISISLLQLMLFQSAGYLLIFKVQQTQIRREIKQRIKAGVSETELVLLKIPRTLEENPNNVFRRIHAREFRYHGNMYDIVRSEQHGDVTWYYCLSDEKETRLFANLDEYVNRDMHHNPEQQKQTERLEHLLRTLFFNKSTNLKLTHFTEEIEPVTYLFRIKTWVSSPSTPPPEV